MAKTRMKPEQVVTLLRQIEVAVANGKTTPQACKEAEVTEQTYYQWRKEYGGLKLDQARRLKELEKENARLKRVVADLDDLSSVWHWRSGISPPSLVRGSSRTPEFWCPMGSTIPT